MRECAACGKFLFARLPYGAALGDRVNEEITLPPALAGEGARLGDANLLGVALVAAGEGAVGISRLMSNAPSPLRLNDAKKIGLIKSRSSPARGEGPQIFFQRTN